jgi:hypothetical protein
MLRAGTSPQITLAALALGGCIGGAPYPLERVPIVGGSPETRSEAEAELADFAAWIGRRLELAEIAFGETRAGSLGRFARSRSRITIDEQLDPSLVRGVLRHELCHAIDYAEDLAEEQPDLLDRLADGLYAGGVLPVDAQGGRRSRRSEALARFCELGPFAARALAEPCPGDAADGTAVMDWLSDTLWTGWQPSATPPPLPGPHASWQAGWDPGGDGFGVRSTEDPLVVEISLGAAVEPGHLQVTLEDGSPASGDLPLGVLADAPPPGLPEGATVSLARGWHDGPGAAVVSYDLYHLGDSPGRLIWSGGKGWAAVQDGCVAADHDLFTTDDDVWLAWVDGTDVSWTPIGG